MRAESFDPSPYVTLLEPFERIEAFAIINDKVERGIGYYTKAMERSGPDDDDEFFKHYFRVSEKQPWRTIFWFLSEKKAKDFLKTSLQAQKDKLVNELLIVEEKLKAI